MSFLATSFLLPVAAIANCHFDGTVDTRYLPIDIPDMDPRIVRKGAFSEYRVPACRLAASDHQQELHWKNLFQDRIGSMKAQLQHQRNLARAMILCGDDKIAAHSPVVCPKVNKFVTETLPERLVEARWNLLLGFAARKKFGSRQDMTRPNARLTSPQFHSFENWDQATAEEREKAKLALLKSIEDIKKNIRDMGQDPEKELAKFKSDLRLTRQVQYHDRFLELVDTYPILLRIKTPTVTGEEIRKLASESLPEFNSREESLARWAGHNDDRHIDELKDALLGPAMAMEPFLEKHPEYCDLVEASLRRQQQMSFAADIAKLTLGVGSFILSFPFGGFAAFWVAVTGASAAFVGHDALDYLQSRAKAQSDIVRSVRLDPQEPRLCLAEVSAAKDELIDDTVNEAINLAAMGGIRGATKLWQGTLWQGRAAVTEMASSNVSRGSAGAR
ncbi:MAG: hypothetical protein C5B49_06740 [Bdellovibrio sp.]|nr:MAG: hypothetical protein C5B49_06740 [Bdellovibrio sp.]